MKEVVHELEALKGQLGAHIEALETWKSTVMQNDLHILPVLQGGQVQVHILNFNKEGGPGATTMEGVPAAFFYEAYREKVAEIFERALEKARSSVATRAEAIKEQLAAEKAAIAAAEKELTDYLKTAPATDGTPKKRGR